MASAKASANAFKASYDQLRNITLTRFSDGTQVAAPHLWENQAALLQIARRPGCTFCREEAALIEARRDIIEKQLGTRIYVVFHERMGVDEFVQKYFPHPGDVFIDESKGFYKATGGGKLRWGGITTFLKPSFWSIYQRNKTRKVEGNLKGEGRILGGLYVVKPGDAGIQYEHVEQQFGDIASLENVIRACEQASGQKLAPEAYDEAVKADGPVAVCTSREACAS
ncbi:AhpC/TSA antioxidant enzyme-domain-containing protein [Syncephalis pseudoplumigaleata]|uniref:Peroxiredoxin-like 2A n=1 Tax=Syncephalis pseudoplumigaleata TaxID=1712513 RepID=A0A4V1J244_9FUNG|nr:AhpC/TSA antioxidant enzyme-domain-containing protein [Syncephalis pseudoplumigaleata]|eukprot:RKP27269.1 AhpC/TSA antioxidant enzyme-domain-containing protein [Syncephalis pseudoplumigaleata]